MGTAMNVESTSAKTLYRPVGLMSSVAGGLVAAVPLRQVRQRAAPVEKPDPSTALKTSYPVKESPSAAAVQGATFSVVKATIDRQGARLFEKVDGRMAGAMITSGMA